MSLVEYIYTDESRLDKYIEQFSSTTTYDKVPVWKAILSIAGPAAEGQQQRFARSLTTHEKITKLLRYLRKEELVAEGRPIQSTGEADAEAIIRLFETGVDETDKLPKEIPFRLESCLARRIRIQLSTFKLPDSYQGLKEDAGLKDINIWLSWPAQSQIPAGGKHENDEGRLPSILYLMEGGQPDDHKYWSVFTTVFQMVEITHAVFTSLVLHPDFLEDKEKAFREIRKKQEDRVKSFSVSPFYVFESLGAFVGPERRIRTLYRVRDTFTHTYQEGKAVVAWGYAIYIAADR